MFLVFFFQAEDGIRDLVRSRGLGDVYKRQTPYDPRSPYSASKASSDHFVRAYENTYNLPTIISVSYTHLTLPTSDLV